MNDFLENSKETDRFSQDIEVLNRCYEKFSADIQELLEYLDLDEENVLGEKTEQADLISEQGITGDIKGDMEHWHLQAYTRSCAIACQEFVAEELLGKDYDETKLMKEAMDQGWYDNGTTPENVGKLLESEGLKVERGYNGTVEEIEKVLAEGGKVIVGVDSGEIVNGKSNDSGFLPGTDANHVVQVIGIDHTDPDNIKIILNDPGTEDGKGSVLSEADFMEAWEDSSRFMVKVFR